MPLFADLSPRLPQMVAAAAASLVALPSCATTAEPAATAAPTPATAQSAPMMVTVNSEAPNIIDEGRASLLYNNSGMTLQWISWDFRGPVRIEPAANGRWHMIGSQRDPDGSGFVSIDGTVTEIGHDYFTFDGEIVIEDSPDAGRRCRANKTWTFAITQNRRYWRLREFEWCDGLTDYIDIYF